MAERIKVWDLGVRLFHWSLVAAFALAWLTSEDESPLHVYAGYAVAGLVAFRLIWGFVGGRYARFGAFLYSPQETLAYVRTSLQGKAKHYLSHNPLGALMVFALLLSLSGVAITGLALNGDLPGQNPVAVRESETNEADEPNAVSEQRIGEQDDDDDRVSATVSSDADRAAAKKAHHDLEEIHEFFANLTLILVGLHILGVIAATRLHKEKLVPAMITGWKDQPDDKH